MKGTLIAAVAGLWLVLCVAAAPADAKCGDGKVDVAFRRTCAPCTAGSTNCPCADVRTALEPCDGRDFDGATCQTQGFFAGKLRCTAACKLDTGRCTKLASDVKALHRTLGPAPRRWISVAFSTNVI